MSYYLTPDSPFNPATTPQPGQFGSLGAIHPNTGGAPLGNYGAGILNAPPAQSPQSALDLSGSTQGVGSTSAGEIR